MFWLDETSSLNFEASCLNLKSQPHLQNYMDVFIENGHNPV